MPVKILDLHMVYSGLNSGLKAELEPFSAVGSDLRLRSPESAVGVRGMFTNSRELSRRRRGARGRRRGSVRRRYHPGVRCLPNWSTRAYHSLSWSLENLFPASVALGGGVAGGLNQTPASWGCVAWSLTKFVGK